MIYAFLVPMVAFIIGLILRAKINAKKPETLEKNFSYFSRMIDNVLTSGDPSRIIYYERLIQRYLTKKRITSEQATILLNKLNKK